MATTTVPLSADDATFDTSLGNWDTSGSGGTPPTRQTSSGGVSPHAGSGMLVVHGVGSDAHLGHYTIPANHIMLLRCWAYGRAQPDGSWRAIQVHLGGGGASIQSDRLQPTWPTTDQWIELLVSSASGPTDSLLQIDVGTSADFLTSNDGLFSDVTVVHEELFTPTGLTAVATSPTEVTLTWAHPTQAINASVPAPAVLVPIGRLGRSDDGGATWLERTGTSPYLDDSLTPGTTYLYRVRARLTTGAAGLPGFTGGVYPTGYAIQGSLPSGDVINSPYGSTVSVTTPGLGGWGVGQIRMGA